jgi:DNA replication and repair protein RecF
LSPLREAARARPTRETDPARPALERLRLRDFRNYAGLELELAPGPIVLFGPNGAGKTNLLEAISLLAPGRGLRRARLESLDRDGAAAPFRLEAGLRTPDGPVDIASGREPESDRRWLEIAGQPVRGLAALADLVAITWLTPAMDRLFVDAAAERRRFLDRLVLGVYPDHARRLAIFERAMRERSLVLRQGPRDATWLDILEQRMAESGVAIAAGRRELAAGLGTLLAEPDPALPRLRLELDGSVETWLDDMAALDAEQRLADALAAARAQDTEAGGAAIGPHRSDLVAIDLATNEAAPRVSTGRQKAMLLAIVLAEVRLRELVAGDLPILLLDETAAHLDPTRRAGLAERLLALGAQVLLTGTERHLFSGLDGHATFIHVDRGLIRADE